MTLEEQILQIKKQIDEIKTKKIQTATELKNLEKEKEKLLQECIILNVQPQKIQETIEEQEKKIYKEITEVQQMLELFDAHI
jgi:chromosome segregation ATPase